MTVAIRTATVEGVRWLAERANLNPHPWLQAFEAVNDKGEIVAVVGYERHYARACMMHVALRAPIYLRHILRPAFEVAFRPFPHGFDCVEAFAPVQDDNVASLRLLPSLGFKQFHHGKDWIRPGVGIVWFSMRRDECRWVKE